MEYNNSITHTLKSKILPLLLSMIMVFLSSCVTPELSPEIEKEFIDSLKSNDIDKAADFLEIYPELGSKEINGTFEGASIAVPAILFALKFGDLDLVKLILKYQDDIDKEFLELTPLKYAIGLNRIDVVNFLIEEGADIEHKTSTSMSTPLIQAVIHENSEIVSLLISHGVQVNAMDFNKNASPLGFAILSQTRNIVNLLLSAGAHGANEKLSFDNLLYISFDEPDFFLTTIDHYQLQEVVSDDKYAVLWGAVIASGRIENLEKLDGLLPLENNKSAFNLALHYASLSNTSTILFLLNQHSFNFNYRDHNNETAVHFAIKNQNLQVATILIKELAANGLYTDDFKEEIKAYFNSQGVSNPDFYTFLISE